MLNILVNTEDGDIAEFLRSLPERLTGEGANAMVAEAAADKVREHFQKLHDTRHRGVTAKSFYLSALDSVEQTATAEEAKVIIPHTGAALRYYGGRVEPSGKISLITGKPITHLAIPRKGSEAEGKTPADYKGQDLELGFGKKSLYLGKREGESKKLTPLFWLVEGSDHKEDKSVLPTDDELVEASEEAIGEYLEEVKRGR